MNDDDEDKENGVKVVVELTTNEKGQKVKVKCSFLI